MTTSLTRSAAEEELTKKQFVFNISRRKLLNILSTFYKNTILRITIMLIMRNIISRNDGENVKDKIKQSKY